MKNVWHYNKLSGNFVADVYGRKVTHVVQYKPKDSTTYKHWNGELDDDRFFSIHILDGVVLATVAEREGELLTKDCTIVAYADGVKSTVDATNEIFRLLLLSRAKLHFLPKFTEELTFEEVMKIFMWEYASSTVEVYENLLV